VLCIDAVFNICQEDRGCRDYLAKNGFAELIVKCAKTLPARELAYLCEAFFCYVPFPENSLILLPLISTFFLSIDFVKFPNIIVTMCSCFDNLSRKKELVKKCLNENVLQKMVKIFIDKKSLPKSKLYIAKTFERIVIDINDQEYLVNKFKLDKLFIHGINTQKDDQIIRSCVYGLSTLADNVKYVRTIYQNKDLINCINNTLDVCFSSGINQYLYSIFINMLNYIDRSQLKQLYNCETIMKQLCDRFKDCQYPGPLLDLINVFERVLNLDNTGTIKQLIAENDAHIRIEELSMDNKWRNGIDKIATRILTKHEF